MYAKFFNDVWQANHIAFYMQSHMAIDQVVNGDIAMNIKGSLENQLVKVERVVDIVQNVFKMSSGMSLLEDTSMLEIPYP